MKDVVFITLGGCEVYFNPDTMVRLQCGAEKPAAACTPEETVLVTLWNPRKKGHETFWALRSLANFRAALRRLDGTGATEAPAPVAPPMPPAAPTVLPARAQRGTAVVRVEAAHLSLDVRCPGAPAKVAAFHTRAALDSVAMELDGKCSVFARPHKAWALVDPEWMDEAARAATNYLAEHGFAVQRG